MTVVTVEYIKKYINQLQSEVEADREMINQCFWTGTNTIRDLLDQLDEQDEWVSVNDRLPSDDEEVLTQAEDGIYNLFRYTEDLYKIDNYDFADCKNKKVGGFYGYDSEFGYFEVDDIVAWKPIEPFKSKE